MVVVDSRPGCTLVLGPARSGKSRWAEHLASRSGLPVHYLATGPSPCGDDPAWAGRIATHRGRRPPGWRTQEVGANLAEAIDLLQPPGIALVDSLGTWVASALELDVEAWKLRCCSLANSLSDCSVPVLLVSEQTGWGVVPATAIGGLFRDRLGALEQQLEPLCCGVWLVVAGRALDLKAHSVAIPPDSPSC
ncbi:MAG: bifunctional adenosylcobinamide kinase/adenosylcobinamide-phosphate guanylyltransferase [Cyanobium sp.]